MTDEQKQKRRETGKQYRENMSDEQKQKRRDYQKEYVKNMTDEQKQKYKDYRSEYYKKYYAAKQLNNNKIIDDNDNDNKTIDDNDNDFYYSSIILKFLNAF